MPLHINAVIKSHANLHPVKKSLNDVMLELPFLDDFSSNDPFPDPAIWTDRFAFINKSYEVNPVSSGVATLDAIDESGVVYVYATIDPLTFDADYLTSQPLNLNYPESDSLYLSFFYQATGNGLSPSAHDSLCLDFYNPTMDLWSNIWQISGDTLKPFVQVMLPIVDTAFLKEGFQFRFRNKASLPHNSDYQDERGNVDHWNIDYVRLDRFRAYNDTVLRDVAFSKPLPSMLKDYQSVPWDHFSMAYNTHYSGNIEIDYFNNDTATRNITRYLKIKDLIYGEEYTPGSPTTQDIFPGTSTSYKIVSIYPFEFGRGDTALFEIKSYLRTDDFDYKSNDTISRLQIFRDYFAYDDGTAERSYGLRGQGTSGGIFAVRFESFISDELGGLDIYFTQIKDSLNLNYYFKFMVWDDFEGLPNKIIYDADVDYRVFYSDGLNKFTRVKFENTVPVNGTFYVGILQYNQYLLNVGLDVNQPSNGNILYNLGSEWIVSRAPGNLMIRPYVLRTYSSAQDQLHEKMSVKLYPNPVSETLNFKFPGSIIEGDVQIKVYNISGQLVASQFNLHQSMYLGNLSEGMYIITFQSDNYSFPSERIIIRK